MHKYRNINSVIKVVVLYVGAIIGAGFATGQEILQFFIVFGQSSFKGAVLAAVLFCYLGGVVMYLSVKRGTQSYRDFYQTILGKLPAKFMDYASLIMLSGGVLVMLAGGGAVFSEHLGLSPFLGTSLTAGICIIVILLGSQGLISANIMLVPIKTIAIFLICLTIILITKAPDDIGRITEPVYGTRVNWIWAAILYVSYNLVVPIAVLSSFGRSFSLVQGVIGGVVGGSLLGALVFLMVSAEFRYYPQIIEYQVPLLFAAGILGSSVRLFLGVLIWLAILTTAIANVHGFASRFAENGTPRYRLMGIGIVLASLPFSNYEFSFLVKVMYPLFGYGGLLMLVSLIIMPPLKYLRRISKQSV